MQLVAAILFCFVQQDKYSDKDVTVCVGQLFTAVVKLRNIKHFSPALCG